MWRAIESGHELRYNLRKMLQLLQPLMAAQRQHSLLILQVQSQSQATTHGKVCFGSHVGLAEPHIDTPYVTVYLVISLPKISYIYRLCIVLANPTHLE
jgi:hypothetical protein